VFVGIFNAVSVVDGHYCCSGRETRDIVPKLIPIPSVAPYLLQIQRRRRLSLTYQLRKYLRQVLVGSVARYLPLLVQRCSTIVSVVPTMEGELRRECTGEEVKYARSPKPWQPAKFLKNSVLIGRWGRTEIVLDTVIRLGEPTPFRTGRFDLRFILVESASCLNMRKNRNISTRSIIRHDGLASTICPRCSSCTRR
jgi:hypothetical protein